MAFEMPEESKSRCESTLGGSLVTPDVYIGQDLDGTY